MTRFVYKGLSYQVSTWGKAGKPPLILLHGFSQSSDTWAPLAPQLMRESCLYAPDFVGHGKSDKPHDLQSYEFEAIKDWLDALIVWIGSDRIDLLGYSMGGRIALAYTVDNPHKIHSLILESTGLGPACAQEASAMEERDRKMIARLESESLEEFMDTWESLPVFESQKHLSPEVRASLRAARMNNDPQALSLTMQGTGQGKMPDYSQKIQQLSAPVLYIAGIQDERYARIANKLKNAPNITSVLLKAGHNTHLEAPQDFIHQVSTFVKGIHSNKCFT